MKIKYMLLVVVDFSVYAMLSVRFFFFFFLSEWLCPFLFFSPASSLLSTKNVHNGCNKLECTILGKWVSFVLHFEWNESHASFENNSMLVMTVLIMDIYF